MLLWGTIILMVVFAVLFYINENIRELIGNVIYGVGFILIVTILIIELVVLGLLYINGNAERVKLKQRYNSLTYKVKAEQIRDEFGIVNKSFVDEVQEWNEEISYYKTMSHDFFVGVFIPDIYDDFETINLEDIQYREEE